MDHQRGVGVVANWRREREGSTVHVVPEAAPALCELDRAQLGLTVWEVGIAAPDLCGACSRKMLHLADEAIRITERIATARELVVAKDSARSLVRVVPDGQIRDLVVYARACLARNDLKGGHDSLLKWRAHMKSIGVLPED